MAGVAGLCLLEVPPAALQALVEDGPAGGLPTTWENQILCKHTDGNYILPLAMALFV